MKIIIVDDEILIRVGIKSCLEWEKYGFEVVGQASDGLQALELVEQTQPDIVLTDIKMPNMDGLELLSQLRKQYPHIKVIILSCHNEIEYVKKAIKMGAEDYILKLSMEPETLIETLNRTKDLIENEKANSSKSENAETEIRVNKYLIKENLFQKLLDGAIPFEEFEKSMSNLGVKLGDGQFSCICCGIDDYKNAPIKSRMEDQHLLKFSFLNIIEEYLTGFKGGYTAEISKGEYMICMAFDKKELPNHIRREVLEYFKKINSALKKYLNISVSFGVAPVLQSFTEISPVYALARKALEYKFYTGAESAVFYNTAIEFLEKPILFDLEKERLFAESLRNLKKEEAREVIDEIFCQINKEKIYSPKRVKDFGVEVLHSAMNVQKRWSLSTELFDQIQNKYSLEILMGLETLNEIRDWFNTFVYDFVETAYNAQFSNVRPEIALIRNYIIDHLDKDITLDLAANIVHISKNYLSSIFKKETGEGFIDYVNRLKMEKAKELIETYNLKTFEAAQKVGITDESYFSKLFKKHIGVNPSKIKKM